MLHVVGDGDEGAKGEGEAGGEDDVIERDLGGEKEDVQYGGLDSFIVVGKVAIEDADDWEEDVEDDGDKDQDDENGVAETEDRKVRDVGGGEEGEGSGGEELEVDKGEEDKGEVDSNANARCREDDDAEKMMMTARV